jgi:hypothetical protein
MLTAKDRPFEPVDKEQTVPGDPSSQWEAP